MRRDLGGGKFGSKVFESEALREATKIGLRDFAFLRSVVGHGGEQHSNGAAAGLFHGRVNGARRFFRGKAAGAFHWRRQMADQAESVVEFADLRGVDGSVADFLARSPTVCDQCRDSAG